MDALHPEYPADWTDYELIDSGEGEKLERFGPGGSPGYTLVRPDPRAIWTKSAPASRWETADATYRRTNSKTGMWETKTPAPVPWNISYRDLTFLLRPTEFKHVGVFPEQAVNWQWLTGVIHGKPLRVLNLFAYTGGATMAAAAAGGRVTHVDAARSTIDWAHENVRVSKLEDKSIRWIEEDAYKFVLRQARRGSTYDGIIMDPPRFGRGTKGEVWKLEHDLPKLVNACINILSPNPAFVLLNAYTADLSSIALGNLLGSAMTKHTGGVSFGELALKESSSGRLLPSGIFARWISKTT